MEGYARCGSPRSRNSARIRSSPNSAGHGVSDSIHLVGESVELTAIALQLLPFCVDDARGRVLDEAIVREDPFRASDLALQQLEQALERYKSRRLCIIVAVVETRLDCLRIPVTEIVEGQVVERTRGRGELKERNLLLELFARAVEPREDPPLDRLLWPRLGF